MNTHSNSSRSLFRESGFVVAVVAVCTGVCFLMFPVFERTNLVMVYLLGTSIVAARGSRFSAALSAILGVLSFDFFLAPPRFTFNVTDAQYLLTFIVMFAVAMIISHLTVRLRQEAESAHQGQRQTEMIHALSERLSSVRGVNQLCKVAVRTTAETFDSGVSLFLPGKNKSLDVVASSGINHQTNEKNRGIAQWVYERGSSAGHGTDYLPETPDTYLPLAGTEGPLGVLCFESHSTLTPIGHDRLIFLQSFARQIGLALEVDRLQESSEKTAIEVQTERLRSALLSSVSHDFRTPLTAIVGSAGAILEKEEIQKNPAVSELAESILSEGERLSHLVQNLLEATRLESGSVHLKKESYPLEEIIGSALERLSKQLKGRQVDVTIPENMPLVSIDALMMEQLFINLLENANRHTPAETPIEISVKTGDKTVHVAVADKGPGLKEENLERVFDKFFHDKSSPGAGLGLAICRAVVSAHGGRIWAENRPGGGSLFQFTLPLESE